MLNRFKDSAKLWMLFASAMSLATNAPLGIAVANYLGPIKFSIISEYLLYSMTLSFIVYAGLETYIVKILSKADEQDRGRIYQSVILIRSFVFILACALFISIYRNNLYVFVIISMFFDVFFFAQQDYESRQRFKKIAQIRIITIVIISASRLIALMIGIANPEFYISIFIVEKIIFISALFLSSLELRSGIKKSTQISIDFYNILSLARRGSFLFVSAFLYFIITRVDQYILVFYEQDIALGNYSLSVRIIEATYFIPTILASIFMAKISDKNMTEYDRSTLGMSEIKGILGYGLGALLFVNVCAYIVSLYFLRGFEFFLEFTFIYSLLLPGLFVYNILKKIIVYNDRNVNLLVIMMMGLVLNIALSFILFGFFGPHGLMVATVLTFYFISLGLGFMCLRFFKREQAL